MTEQNRIILNTLANYGQSLVALLVGLFSARWTLHALGETDFGLFGVVGSIILMLSILNGGLSVAVVRFYAIALGRGQNKPTNEVEEDIRRWFNTALSLHILMPMLAILVGLPLGEHAIRHWLTIPVERMDACIWVFRASLLSAFASILSLPFIAMFRARQRMFEIALFGMAQSIAVFALAWQLSSVYSDRLVYYGAGMALITAVAAIAQCIRAYIVFPSCRPKFAYLCLRSHMRELFSYAGWKMFGMACVTLRAQGIPILANLQFGPLGNAAYGVAYRLSTQATSLSTSLLSAFEPALIAAEGKGDRIKMIRMSIQVSNFSTFLIVLFVVPLILEMQNLLALWLVHPPRHVSAICQWLLAALIIDKMTSGTMLAVNAFGKITLYELVQGLMFLLALPLIWLFFRLGYGLASIGYALFASHALYCLGRLLFARHLVGYPLMEWTKAVAIPNVGLIAVSSLAGLGVVQMFEPGLLRLILTTAAVILFSSLAAWRFTLLNAEKNYVFNTLRKFLKKKTPSSIVP